MRFLIDECLHESLAGVAHDAGYAAQHVNHLGLSGQQDRVMALRIITDEYTFVTNNRADFIQLLGKTAIHPGLIIVVPNVVPALQRMLFGAALRYWAGRNLVNTVIKVSLAGGDVRCVEYELPTRGGRHL